MSLRRQSLLLLGLAWALLARAAAAAPDRRACLAASEDGQTLKIRGALTAARAKLSVCADPACPQIVRTDCARWIEQIDKLVPTIVIGAQDAATGRDLLDVRVLLDGAPFATSIDGRAVAIDPGPHTLRFEADHYVPHEERIVALEGEQGRVLNVRLVHVPAHDAEPPPPPRPLPAPPPLRVERTGAPPKPRRVRWSLGLDTSIWVLSTYQSSDSSLQYDGGTGAGLKLVGRMSYAFSRLVDLHVDATAGALFLGSDAFVKGVDEGDSQNFVTLAGRVELQINPVSIYSIRVGADLGTWLFLDEIHQDDDDVMLALGGHASLLTFHFGFEKRLTLSADETVLALFGRLGLRTAFEQTLGFGYSF